MKALALSIAIAAISLPSAASAQTRVITEHSETAATLACLLAHGRGCNQNFIASAGRLASNWQTPNSIRDFNLGPLVSSEYAGTQSANAYTTALLNGRTADVYLVKFRHQERTFYIARPGPDGKIHSMLIRNGAPNDEMADLWASNPLGRF